MEQIYATLQEWPIPLAGFVGSLFAGGATTVGALAVFAVRATSPRTEAILLGFSAGVMLAATSFSLIVPGVAAAVADGASTTGAALIMSSGILAGGAFLWLLHERVPHEHFIKGPEGRPVERLARVWLFILAITIHNFPEGLAVGVGFGRGDPATGVPLALGIGLQNIPEGFVVSLALVVEGYRRSTAFWVGVLTGLVEPVGGLVGAGAIAAAGLLMPIGMAFAAGAMLFVISGEMIPETHRAGRSVPATFGILVGFVVMMVMDVALG